MTPVFNRSDTISYTPSFRLFLCLAFLVLLGLGCFFWEPTGLIWMGFLGLLSALMLVDFVLLFRCNATLKEARWNRQPVIEQMFSFTLELETRLCNAISLQMEAIDSDLLVSTESRALLENPGANRLLATWELFSRQRGNVEWPGANLRFRSPLGLINRWQRLSPVSIPIYPRINLDLRNQLNPKLLMEQLGLKINRHRRSEQDFESLRPYVTGDNYRHIDWKASARMQTLISRQFQVEHHHNILICLDRSRLMGTTTAEGVTKLDWAVEAALHLAYLAARFNDRIGLLVFSNEVERWVKPVSRPLEMFLQNLYDLRCKIVEADFQKACASVMTGQRKRSLVIFLSDFLDAGSLEPSLNTFKQLNRRHCTLFVGIEDPTYKKYLEQERYHSALELVQRIVAQDSMHRRRVVLRQIRQMGLKALTVSPENLVQRLMDAYLEIKFQGAI